MDGHANDPSVVVVLHEAQVGLLDLARWPPGPTVVDLVERESSASGGEQFTPNAQRGVPLELAQLVEDVIPAVGGHADQAPMVLDPDVGREAGGQLVDVRWTHSLEPLPARTPGRLGCDRRKVVIAGERFAQLGLVVEVPAYDEAGLVVLRQRHDQVLEGGEVARPGGRDRPGLRSQVQPGPLVFQRVKDRRGHARQLPAQAVEELEHRRASMNGLDADQAVVLQRDIGSEAGLERGDVVGGHRQHRRPGELAAGQVPLVEGGEGPRPILHVEEGDADHPAVVVALTKREMRLLDIA
jgi:hypothetical protein